MLMLLKSMQPGRCFIYADRLHMVHKHELKGDQWDRTIAYNLHNGRRVTWAKWHIPNSPVFEVVQVRLEEVEWLIASYPDVEIGRAVGRHFLKTEDGILDLHTGNLDKDSYDYWTCKLDAARLIVIR